MYLKSVLSTAASVCASFFLCASAGATPITAGQTVIASTIVPGSLTEVGGTGNPYVAFTSQAPAGSASTFSGTYAENVFRDSANNLCLTAGQCLTFVILLNNSSTSTDGIETVTTGPFSSAFTYNVGYNSSNGGDAPIYISDSPSGTIGFNFTSQANTSTYIRPGQSSDYLIIQTSATNYSSGNISFQDNQTATVAGFIPSVPTVVGPTAATPEPSSFALLGTGICGITGVVRKRFAR